MIGFHLQGSVDDWPDGARHLPDYTPIKFTDGGPQRAVEAKGINATLFTAVRYVVQDQNPSGDFHQHARNFFAMFVDETFRQHAWAVDAVHEYNEYFANSQGKAEKDKWVDWASACVDVWRDDYRTQPEYADIGLIIAETSVGNDIPIELAALSHRYPWVHIGYHPYVPVYKGEIRPDAWDYYSGRWDGMDRAYGAAGYTNVTWFFGEFGAVGHNGPGWPNSLAPNDGWRHPDVYNGDLAGFEDMLLDWMQKVEKTAAWIEGRVIGAVLFTSGGGSRWRHFEVKQPEMTEIAQFVAENTPDRGTPPVEPPRGTPPGLPRVQYRREYRTAPQDAIFEEYMVICAEAFWAKATVGFSYDDAGIGALDEKAAWLYGISPGQKGLYERWFEDNYPGTELTWLGLPFVGRNPDIKLAAPVADIRNVTQLYGENYSLYMQRFGKPGHNGLDFGAPEGTPVLMSAPGTIKHAGTDPDGYGDYIIISHGDGVETIYAHMSSIEYLNIEFWYEAGTQVGKSGNSGWSDGPHLHFGLKIDGQDRDPAQWLV